MTGSGSEAQRNIRGVTRKAAPVQRWIRPADQRAAGPQLVQRRIRNESRERIIRRWNNCGLAEPLDRDHCAARVIRAVTMLASRLDGAACLGTFVVCAARYALCLSCAVACVRQQARTAECGRKEQPKRA